QTLRKCITDTHPPPGKTSKQARAKFETSQKQPHNTTEVMLCSQIQPINKTIGINKHGTLLSSQITGAIRIICK
ncbi:hypothetical protein ACX80Z_09955, partial [Arthrobacter sp. TMT4-20]